MTVSRLLFLVRTGFATNTLAMSTGKDILRASQTPSQNLANSSASSRAAQKSHSHHPGDDTQLPASTVDNTLAAVGLGVEGFDDDVRRYNDEATDTHLIDLEHNLNASCREESWAESTWADPWWPRALHSTQADGATTKSE